MPRVIPRPLRNIVKHNPDRLVPDDEPSDCVRYRAVSVGLSKFLTSVKSIAQLREEHTPTGVNYFDATGLLVAQMVWSPNEVGEPYCRNVLF